MSAWTSTIMEDDNRKLRQDASHVFNMDDLRRSSRNISRAIFVLSDVKKNTSDPGFQTPDIFCLKTRFLQNKWNNFFNVLRKEEPLLDLVFKTYSKPRALSNFHVISLIFHLIQLLFNFSTFQLCLHSKAKLVKPFLKSLIENLCQLQFFISKSYCYDHL